MIETLGDILRNNAYKFPYETAFVYEGQRITFKEHFDRSNRLAAAF